MIEKRKENARRYVEGIGSGNMPEDIIAPDFSGWSTLSGDTPGDVFLARTKMIREVFPDGLDFTFIDVIGEGNLVALRCTSKGTTFEGVPYANDYHYQFIFDDGARIRQTREYMDSIKAAEVIRPAFARLAELKAAR